MLPIYEKPPETLKELKERILETLNAGWTQKVYAIDKNGHSIDPFSTEAMCCCLVGAMLRATYGQGFACQSHYFLHDAGPSGRLRKAFSQKFTEKSKNGMATYNDHHTKEEVIAVVESINCD